MTFPLRDLVAAAVAGTMDGSPANRLDDFGGGPVFGAPLVGVADGDDPVFEALKTAVGPRHMMPRDVLRGVRPTGPKPPRVSVVAWALPFTEEIRRSNRDREWPSDLYSVARNNGGAVLHEVALRLPAVLADHGIASVVPALTEGYDAFRDPARTFTSTWSERHVAFAAGLGRFGLNGALITAAGTNVRLGSIVTDHLPDDALPPRGDHRAPCLRSGGGVCGLCAAKCPVRAIAEGGLDKSLCNARRKAVRERSLDLYIRTYRLYPSPVVKSGRRAPGYSLGCAVCQAGVPCEDGDPFPKP